MKACGKVSDLALSGDSITRVTELCIVFSDLSPSPLPLLPAFPLLFPPAALLWLVNSLRSYFIPSLSFTSPHFHCSSMPSSPPQTVIYIHRLPQCLVLPFISPLPAPHSYFTPSLPFKRCLPLIFISSHPSQSLPPDSLYLSSLPFYPTSTLCSPSYPFQQSIYLFPTL